MRLISLDLENFRQHKSSKIELTDGITVIMGSNGSGKSTILEAISWAIYGTEAARGNKDSIKWNRAPAKSKVKVELVFSIDNETYKVIRFLDKAEVYVNDGAAPVATTQQEVTKYLVDKLGMTRDEFFNTYFTGQKELNFLANQKPVERRKFISKVLGYDRIRIAQENVRIDKNNLSNEVLGLKQGLADIDHIQAEKDQIQQDILILSKNVEQKKIEVDKYTLELGKLHPDWSKLKSAREEFNKVKTELSFMMDKLAEYEKGILGLSTEILLFEQKEKRLNEIEAHLIEYKKIEKEIQKQEKLQNFEVEKHKHLTILENIEKDISLLNKKLQDIQKSLDLKADLSSKIDFLKKDIESSKIAVQSRWAEWTSKKQEIKALIRQKESELNKVASQYSLIEQKGENGACPTCERPLKGEFEKVTSGFQETITKLSTVIQELVFELNKLENEPDVIQEIRKNLDSMEREFDSLNKQYGSYEEEIKLLDTIRRDLENKNSQNLKINEALKNLPQGFDRDLYEKLKADFSALKRIYDEILGLKAQLSAKDKVRQSLDSAIKIKVETDTRKNNLESRVNDLNYSEEAYKKLEELILQVEKSLHSVRYDFVKSEGELNQAKAILQKVLESEKSYREKFDIIKSKQNELNHLIELDRFYGVFLEKLNNEARPELSEIAGEYLQELTESRYTVLELNEKYEICLREDPKAEIRPVISGGEEDIANLCVRLGISKMIAQRSGKALSLLILDEVFGSLDENRRNKVVTLLNSLTNSFEQVILITHIDDIKESIDSIIKVEYNEEEGCSDIVTYASRIVVEPEILNIGQ